MKTSRWWRHLGLLAVVACVPPTEVLWLPATGYIDVFPAATTLVMPTAVTEGEPFDITVTTSGSSDCRRALGANVEIEASVATVTPRDLFPAGKTTCYRDLAGYPRIVRLEFDAPGTATVRIRGRASNGEIIFIERTLTVEPSPD